MASPFVYEKPVAPGALIDRRAELTLLTDRALDARNSRLEGPRRFGKTSLVEAALAEVAQQNAIVVKVDFLGCVSVADVADRIERAYSAHLDRPLRRWFDGVARTLQPTVSAAPAGIGVKTHPRPGPVGLLDRLALPRRLHERTGRICVIAFDEFQEIMRVDASLPGVFRSEIESQGDAAAYIFSGSHPGLMRELFSDRRRAFFAQATPVVLGPLPADDLADHITAQMEVASRDPGEALGPLLDTAEGHPQRAMLLAHHLYEQTRPQTGADIEAWARALAAARQEVFGEIQVLWDSCTEIERRVLKVIASRTVKLGSHEALQRFALAKGGSNNIAVNRLWKDGHLFDDETTATKWRIVDPLLAMWLREGPAS
jgi:uncharacterized protein